MSLADLGLDPRALFLAPGSSPWLDTPSPRALGDPPRVAMTAPPPPSRRRRVAEARRHALAALVPEGAEDNLDALQHAMDRLEGDAARSRRDVLVAAAKALGEPVSPVAAASATSSRHLAVATALADVTDAPPSATSPSNPPTSDDPLVAPPPGGWCAASDAATRDEDVALASAAAHFRAALLDARLRSRRVERLALEAEAEARRDDALAKTDAGDFARAADALARLDEALAAVAERAGDEDADPESNVPPADHHPDASAAANAAASALRLRALRRDAADLREFLRERVVAAFEESVWVEETDDGSFAIVADPLRAERAWEDLRTAGDEAAGGAARELGDRLAMDFFLPLVDAAADEGAVVRCVVERVEVMIHRGGAEEDDAMTEKTAEEGLEVERDESKGGVVSLRRLRWTTDGERGAPDEVVVPALASALETSLRFATGAMGATRLCAYSRAVGAVAWGAVAAAAQARWFADADIDHEFDSSRAADEDRAADSAAIDAPSSRADVFLLSDACVDALCAAEAAAASAGWAPAPPATGPLEAAARARDRGIEGAIRAEVLAGARRVFVDATDAELYATFRAGGESEAIEANRRQSPMSWDPSKEDAGVFFSNPSERDDSSSPGNTGNTTKTAPALAASTVSTVARRLADVAVGALESAVGAASTELDASAKRGTPPNRAALVRALARARGAADAADAFRVLAPAARARARTRNAGGRGPFDPSFYSHLVSERRDGEQLWGELGPESVADAGPHAACVFRNDARYVASRWLAAAYAARDALERAAAARRDERGTTEKGTDATKSSATSVSLTWQVAPLVADGDRALALMLERTRSDVAAALGSPAALFADLGDAGLVTSRRKVRVARHALGRACAAATRLLEAPIGTEVAAGLASGYASAVLGAALSVSDVGADEAEAFGGVLNEAFAAEGLLPPREDAGGEKEGGGGGAGCGGGFAEKNAAPGGLGVGDTRVARRAAADAEAAAMLAACATRHWRVGAKLGSLLDARLEETARGWEDGTLPAIGFRAGEVRAVVGAVFEDSEHRRAALARIR